nr:exopolysaccharide biosynthesis protein [Rhizobium sp. Q54]
MRVAKTLLIDPGHNQLYGVVAIALSFFVFAYSSRFGQVSILAYYGVWLPLILVDYRRVLGNYFRYGWIFAFALFCFLSAFWSQAPAISLRAAVQYLTHVACALIAMRVLSTATLSRGAVVGCAVVLLYSMLFGNYHYDALDGTYSFVGAFSSKNQLGFYASLGVLFAYATAIIFRTRLGWLLACAATGLLSSYALLASQSATSIITTLGVLAASLVMQATLLLAPRARVFLFVAGIVLAIGGGAVALQFGALDALLGVFGKDSTLTGRTYLWQQGVIAAAHSPWIGVGYYGYWVPGFAEAERLWQDFFITSRSGFHFHNTFIEATVETGTAGAVLLAILLFRSFSGHLGRFIRTASSPQSLVLAALSFLLVIRSFVEIDIMHPYHIGSFLLYFAAGKLTLTHRQSLVHSQPRRRYALSPN